MSNVSHRRHGRQENVRGRTHGTSTHPASTCTSTPHPITCRRDDGERAVLPGVGPEPQRGDRLHGAEGVEQILLGIVQADVAVGQGHQEARRRPSLPNPDATAESVTSTKQRGHYYTLNPVGCWCVRFTSVSRSWGGFLFSPNGPL